jgi:hypothetical protein
MDQENTTDIAEIKARLAGHDDDLARHDEAIRRHDELIAGLREAITTVATKDDVHALSLAISETHAQQMRDALNSVPGKIALFFTGGGFIVALVALILDWAVRSHG